MLKKNVLTTLVLLLAVSLTAVHADKRQVILDRVVAVVGGSSILYSEVSQTARQLVEQRRAQGYTSDRDPMNEGLEELMKQKLLYNQALIDSVVVGMDGRIEASVEDQMQRLIAEAGSVTELEIKEHMPMFSYRDILRQKITEQVYAQEMQNHVTSSVVVTPGEVERFFKELKDDDKPLVPEQYVYAHIVRSPSAQDEAKRRTKERLLDMRERIISGKSTMAILARTYSQDPGSAMKGGEYPPGPLSGLTPPFADALAKLKAGQISEVVETEFGFHLIELIDEPKNGMYHYRHILLKPVYTLEEELEPTKYLDSLALMIKSDSITFEAAALEHSQDNLTKMNGGLVTNHDLLMHYNAGNVKYTATKFRREDFGERQQDYINLIQLKVGEVSSAFVTTDVSGNSISKIVKLLEIIPTHLASMQEDYLTIEEMALEEKKNKVFDKWMKEKIDGLYIFVDPEFREGDFKYSNWVK
ncbi:MAG: peptidylprolyl isomerase [Alistipes sp.]|jgi:peptidyl-prolyl cis-trans isomerase SurA|nr:peptidylprolyl isomerase [Alistipes sp.]MBO7195232.1 peptidylprolyl isomerase [Alistipes sp.]